MNRPRANWNKRFLELSAFIARWSKDPSTKVGAVIVRPDNSVCSTGFNGFPPDHDDSAVLYSDREYKYKHVIHAEVNALNFLQNSGETPEGFSLYTSFPTCPLCAERAIKDGIKRIIHPPLPIVGRSQLWIDEWKGHMVETKELCEAHGVELLVRAVV